MALVETFDDSLTFAETILVVASLAVIGYFGYQLFTWIGQGVGAVVDANKQMYKEQVQASGEPCQSTKSACDPTACNKPNFCTSVIGTTTF